MTLQVRSHGFDVELMDAIENAANLEKNGTEVLKGTLVIQNSIGGSKKILHLVNLHRTP